MSDHPYPIRRVDVIEAELKGEARDAACEWVRANRLDPGEISASVPIEVHMPDPYSVDGARIHYRRMLHSPGSTAALLMIEREPGLGTGVLTEPATAPLVVAIPKQAQFGYQSFWAAPDMRNSYDGVPYEEGEKRPSPWPRPRWEPDPVDHPAPHETVQIRHGQLAADVDEAIAPLIHALWVLNINTEYSCQGNPGDRAYIKFADVVSADLFAREMAERADDDMDWRTTHNGWEWTIALAGRHYCSTVTVRFPAEQLPVVAALFTPAEA